MKYYFSLIFVLISIFLLKAQPMSNSNFIRCSTEEIQNYNLQKLNIERKVFDVEFEKWIFNKITEDKNLNNKNNNTVYTIPVVFHVFHNGDEIGTNENISDLQIQSQITILNQDFRRKINTPGYNTNPVGADTEIEFCLAQIDPNGNYTNGIKRHYINNQSYTPHDVEDVKPNYIWNSSQYLNIFIVNFSAPNSGYTLGYAQFPLGSGLPGLSSGMGYNDTTNTDGVVLNYMVVGSRSIYSQGNYALDFDKGRTATHEVAHWLGLRHIWGDIDSCTAGTDYCEDTPHHKNKNTGCPTNKSPCGIAEMVENYMDYTNDDCLNTFTQDQKTRMRTVLANDYRRNFLTQTNKCTFSPTYFNDVGIVNIETHNINCNVADLNIEFVNLGRQVVNVINYKVIINGQSQNFSLNRNILAPGICNIAIPIQLISGNNSINVQIISVNNLQDDNNLNNQKSINVESNYFSSSTSNLQMELLTDRYPNEIIWKFKGPNTILSNQSLLEETLYSQTLPMESAGCYTFEITDRSGDGICCNYGLGNLKLILDGVTIYDSGLYGEGLKFNFYNATLKTNQFNYASTYILPNPAVHSIQIISPEFNYPISFSIINNLGQIVLKNKNISKDNKIDISTLNTGIYFIQLESKEGFKNYKFIKK